MTETGTGAEEIEEHIHRSVSTDGTEIAGRFVGQGPSLVFLPAGPGTSEASWRRVVPHLSDRFTCYLVDTRGRGLSAPSHDHRPACLCDDIVSFVRSLDAPAGIVEWGSDLWGRVAVAAGDAVSGIAVYDTGIDAVMDPALAPRFGEVIGGVAERARQGNLEEAAEFLIEHSHLIYSDEDYHDETVERFWREAAPHLPVFAQQLMLAGEAPAGETADPDTLARVPAPALLMRGVRSHAWFRNSIDDLAGHLPNATVRDIDAAHFGPYRAPAAIAHELSVFFASGSTHHP